MRIAELLNWNNEPAQGISLILNSICLRPDLPMPDESRTRLHTAWFGQELLETRRIGKAAVRTSAAQMLLQLS
jgi:hypothetical protein